MCRNIRTLFNFDPPATDEEIRASALQFVRKLSGFTEPSKANEPAFRRAVEEVSDAARRLLDALDTARPPRNREEEAMKARAGARAVRIAARDELIAASSSPASRAAARRCSRSAGKSRSGRRWRSSCGPLPPMCGSW